jgi:hypothetical protein
VFIVIAVGLVIATACFVGVLIAMQYVIDQEDYDWRQ